MHNNVVSVVITNYNREKFLSRAIRSCLDQIVFNTTIEIIVVDDCSTDESMKILDKFRDNIKVISHSKNLGVAAASNTGVKNSTGEYVIRLDADDFLNKLAIHIMYSVLNENKDIHYVYGDIFKVDDDGFKEYKIILDNNELLYEHGAGILFRKKIIEEVGYYDENLKNCEDYDLLIKIVKKYKGFHVPIPLYRYYMHDSNLTKKCDRSFYKKLVRDNHGI